jgi:uncharacterized MAPEG superfamily protein
MHACAALITVLTVILIFIASGFVGRARGIHKIDAPATSGHPEFERAFRAHMNTIEQAVLFLPLLWLASIYGNERLAAGLGLAWLLGRAWYIAAYLKDASRRSGGFLVGLVALAGLLLMSAWGIGQALLG